MTLLVYDAASDVFVVGKVCIRLDVDPVLRNKLRIYECSADGVSFRNQSRPDSGMNMASGDEEMFAHRVTGVHSAMRIDDRWDQTSFLSDLDARGIAGCNGDIGRPPKNAYGCDCALEDSALS